MQEYIEWLIGSFYYWFILYFIMFFLLNVFPALSIWEYSGLGYWPDRDMIPVYFKGIFIFFTADGMSVIENGKYPVIDHSICFR